MNCERDPPYAMYLSPSQGECLVCAYFHDELVWAFLFQNEKLKMTHVVVNAVIHYFRFHLVTFFGNGCEGLFDKCTILVQ